MLVSTTPETIILAQIEGWDIDGYAFSRMIQSGTIFVNRYQRGANNTWTFFDRQEIALTLQELGQRMTTTISGKSLAEELPVWAEAVAKARGIIPADAVLLGATP